MPVHVQLQKAKNECICFTLLPRTERRIAAISAETRLTADSYGSPSTPDTRHWCDRPRTVMHSARMNTRTAQAHDLQGIRVADVNEVRRRTCSLNPRGEFLSEREGGTSPTRGANRNESMLSRPLIREGNWRKDCDVRDGRFHEWSRVPLM